ncbi:MAG: GNAT family N-acetyltransferase [Magnetococcales bacterium]|nr:GNAT family N-acetyltransferase [Magnetococcales bacterium]
MQHTVTFRTETMSDALCEPLARLGARVYQDQPAFLPQMTNPAYFRWKHVENPAGKSRLVNAYDGDRLVGSMAYQQRTFLCRGRPVAAAVLTNLMLDPEHQDFLVFMGLAQSLRRAPEFFPTFILPNEQSTILHEKALKLPLVTPLTLFLFPLRPGNLVQRLFKTPKPLFDGLGWLFCRMALLTCPAPAGWSFCSAPRHPDDPESLIQAHDQRETVTGIRDAAFRSWRHGSGNPVWHYRTWYLYRHTELLGLVVTRRTRYQGLDGLFIIDCILDADLSGPALRYLRGQLLRLGMREGCEVILGMVNGSSPSAMKMVAWPFLRVPATLLPLPIVLRRARGKDDAAWDAQLWQTAFITLADLDIL